MIVNPVPTVRVSDLVEDDSPTESPTCTVKVDVPVAVGVPLITPSVDSDSPAGNEPDATDHEYGGVPPEADNVCEYADPTTPAGSDEVVIVSDELMVIESSRVAVWDALSVT